MECEAHNPAAYIGTPWPDCICEKEKEKEIMPTPQIIGLYGPSRAGKDETATILVSDFGYEQRAQAAAIREILLGLNPLILDDSENLHQMKDLFFRCGENWDNVKAVSRDATDYMIRLGQTCRDV